MIDNLATATINYFERPKGFGIVVRIILIMGAIAFLFGVVIVDDGTKVIKRIFKHSVWRTFFLETVMGLLFQVVAIAYWLNGRNGFALAWTAFSVVKVVITLLSVPYDAWGDFKKDILKWNYEEEQDKELEKYFVG